MLVWGLEFQNVQIRQIQTAKIIKWREIQTASNPFQVGRPREGQGDAAQRQGGAAGEAGGRGEELPGMPDWQMDYPLYWLI